MKASGCPANPAGKPGYVLEFKDEIQDTELNTGRWLPFYPPKRSSRDQAAARYSLPGSYLELPNEADQPPWCQAFDGEVRVASLQTGGLSGLAGGPHGQHKFKPALIVAEPQPTLKLYTPPYGYFETRLKALPIPDYLVVLWMIGFEARPEQWLKSAMENGTVIAGVRTQRHGCPVWEKAV